MDDNCYRVKLIKYKGRDTPVLLQDVNGPCPILAIANVLLLRNQLKLPAGVGEVSEERLVQLVAGYLLDSNSLDGKEASEEYRANLQHNLTEALALLPKLTTGIDVNVRFHDIRGFEFTNEVAVFDLLDIGLVHGWLCEPQDEATCCALGSKSYNELVIQLVTTLGGAATPKRVTPASSFKGASGQQQPSPLRQQQQQEPQPPEEAAVVGDRQGSQQGGPISAASLAAALRSASSQAGSSKRSSSDGGAEPSGESRGAAAAGAAAVGTAGSSGAATPPRSESGLSAGLSTGLSTGLSSGTSPSLPPLGAGIGSMRSSMGATHSMRALIDDMLTGLVQDTFASTPNPRQQAASPATISQPGKAAGELVPNTASTPPNGHAGTAAGAASVATEPASAAAGSTAAGPSVAGMDWGTVLRLGAAGSSSAAGAADSSLLVAGEQLSSVEALGRGMAGQEEAGMGETVALVLQYPGEAQAVDGVKVELQVLGPQVQFQRKALAPSPFNSLRVGKYAPHILSGAAQPQTPALPARATLAAATAAAGEGAASKAVSAGAQEGAAASGAAQAAAPEASSLATAGAEQAGSSAAAAAAPAAVAASPDEGAVHDALLIQQFLEGNPSQLTWHGLHALHEGLRENQLAVFFRNNHFNTVLKQQGGLYILVTDQGYQYESDVVWEHLATVDGDTQFVDSEFRPFQAHAAPAAAEAGNAPAAEFEPQGRTTGTALAQEDADLALALALQQEEHDRLEREAERAAQQAQQQHPPQQAQQPQQQRPGGNVRPLAQQQPQPQQQGQRVAAQPQQQGAPGSPTSPSSSSSSRKLKKKIKGAVDDCSIMCQALSRQGSEKVHLLVVAEGAARALPVGALVVRVKALGISPGSVRHARTQCLQPWAGAQGPPWGSAMTVRAQRPGEGQGLACRMAAGAGGAAPGKAREQERVPGGFPLYREKPL
ncbi:hypothetical protein N2152v2_004874 [Parachlorella kessleri]